MSPTIPEPKHVTNVPSVGHTDPPVPKNIWRLFVYSAIGAFVFFFPLTYQDKSSIPLDHMVTIVRDSVPAIVPWIILALAGFGAGRSIYNQNWKEGTLAAIFVVTNVIGFIIAVLAVLDALPWVLGDEDMVPFLWEKIATPVGLIVPIGSAFLALLVSYGFLEFIGVLMQPIMRPLWKTPGRSAIDAVASFVGSYSLGILITDRVYQRGGYTAKEAAIIATGFSTVSAAFMVIVANALGLMEIWTTFFFVTLVVTFLVTAITVRIPPLSRIPDDYHEGATPEPETEVSGSRVKAAWHEALYTLENAPSLWRAVRDSFVDGVKMAGAIVPSILSVGLGGILLERFTPVFEWIGYLFYPFAWIVRLPETMDASQAMATGIAEMFLPAASMAGAEDLVAKFVVGVVSISMIIFFSALIPCIMATRIPISLTAIVIIWFERVALTILIATPIAHLLL
ncbi:YjiH family protein [Corynebacterium pseudodiphtheriticum]|uniref:YjiH family protein n=1 Tax=Corynebacterium pseudodiphtheriticum TaxID=37637 RepID=UPI003D6DA7C9